MLNIPKCNKEIFNISFQSESDYSNTLAHYLEDVFGVVVQREVGKRLTRNGDYGIADIYIPIVNAVIECKKHSSHKRQAWKQLRRYGKLFNTELLFFAASDDVNTVDSIVSALSDAIQIIKLPMIKELENSWIKLARKHYKQDKRYFKLAHVSMVSKTNKSLEKVKKIVICKEIKDKIEGELARLDNEWFTYSYMKGWYKPECTLDPSRFGACWEHPCDIDTVMVKTKIHSCSHDYDGVSFYSLNKDRIYFKDSCGSDKAYLRFEERKKSCLGLPCSFDDGFTVTDDGIFLTSPIGRTASYKLAGEAMLLAFLLHPDTKGWEDFILSSTRQFDKYGCVYDTIEDFLTNTTIGSILANIYAKQRSVVDERQLEIWTWELSAYNKAARNCATPDIIRELVSDSIFEKYFTTNKINFANKNRCSHVQQTTLR